MALLAGEIAEIVWAETRAFGEAPGDGSGNVNGVRRLVAVLAASTTGTGFERRESLPSVDDRRYGETARAIMRIAEDARAVTTPQNRLIIWETNDESTELNGRTDPPPPAPGASLRRARSSTTCASNCCRTAIRSMCSRRLPATAGTMARCSSTR